jgi:hypothetical protein
MPHAETEMTMEVRWGLWCELMVRCSTRSEWRGGIPIFPAWRRCSCNGCLGLFAVLLHGRAWRIVVGELEVTWVTRAGCVIRDATGSNLPATDNASRELARNKDQPSAIFAFSSTPLYTPFHKTGVRRYDTPKTSPIFPDSVASLTLHMAREESTATCLFGILLQQFPLTKPPQHGRSAQSVSMDRLYSAGVSSYAHCHRHCRSTLPTSSSSTAPYSSR